jgi:nicotinate phosphoribosyltransferase
MHGIDAGLKAARAFHIAGVSATSNVAAGQLYGIPVAGTMAHSYVQAHDRELDAFRQFTRLYPDTTLLVDTYDTVAGVEQVVALARELGSEFHVRAIRLDSGDLAALAVKARQMLDAAGLSSVRIFASGGLDDTVVAALVNGGAPIDAFGVGTDLGVSRDAPSLDIAYKLVSYAGVDRVKLSPGKLVLPGRKQVYRIERDGVATHDVIALAEEPAPGRPLLVPVMKQGQRLPAGGEHLDEARRRAANETERLPSRLRGLSAAQPAYVVEISPLLQRHYDESAHAFARDAQ